jgi:prepilin-type N-terminal cleavage/methylation domain-containing protein/prepilin-type processing-associated H-X9-DG protein
MERRHAFTLIELLVVIAIILALLAILMPSLNKALAVGESAVCASNQRQLHMATMAYTADNFTLLPGAREWVDNSIAWTDSWKTPQAVKNGLLYPYVGRSDPAYLCPTFMSVYTINPSNAGATPAFCYTMNIYFIRPDQVTRYPSINKVSQVVAPSSLFLYAEENPWVPAQAISPLNDPLLAPTWMPTDSPMPLLDALGTYHLGRDVYSGTGNAAFVDGHSERRPIEDTYEIGTPHNFR